MGLTTFILFISPWMGIALWLGSLPRALRLGTPTAPWRALTDYPDPPPDQRHEVNARNSGDGDGSGMTGGDKHNPLINPRG